MSSSTVWYGYSDGSASLHPHFGGWAFVVTPDAPSDSWDPKRIISHGRGGARGMKLGEAEISPLMYGLKHLEMFLASGDVRPGSISWMVDSEYVAMVWSGAYKPKEYRELWARIRKGADNLSSLGIEFDVVHQRRNRCPGQIWVDEYAGKGRKIVIDRGADFADLTYRILREEPIRKS